MSAGDTSSPNIPATHSAVQPRSGFLGAELAPAQTGQAAVRQRSDTAAPASTCPARHSRTRTLRSRRLAITGGGGNTLSQLSRNIPHRRGLKYDYLRDGRLDS
uniref:Uncharacterized protein n=1 Tax=Mycena chlorophos TaxID=658473 RepID=A0ABQ0L3G1_MYCCL|nr:predicted protein [Mycena chlorophos]